MRGRRRAHFHQSRPRHARGLLSRASAAERVAIVRLMRAIAVVALHVFRDSVRDKVLYSIVAFAVLLMAVSYLIGQLTAGEDLKIIKDLGLAAMSLLGLFIAIFIGVGLVAKEMDRRSIYAVLVKPVRRHEFIIGKYLGLVGTLVVNLAVMAAAYYVVLVYMGWKLHPATIQVAPAPPTDPRLLLAIVLIACELALVPAVALFLSTIVTRAFLSAGLTAATYIAGQLAADRQNFGPGLGSRRAGPIGRWLYYTSRN